MRRYHHLLTLRTTSKRLFNPNTSPTKPHHHLHRHHHRGLHPHPPPQPRKPINMYGRSTFVSHNFGNWLPKPNHCDHPRTIHTSELPLYENDYYPLEYSVTVKAKEVISAAASPANAHCLPLSNLDLLLPPIECGVFFCYKKKNTVDMSPETVVKTIKESLAGVLSTYYPLAGEIVENSQGEPEVLCNNSGVEFVHAHADVELNDLDLYRPDHSVKGKLVPKLNYSCLLSVQVTELNCGSIIISCTFNHQLTDGHSLNMFLLAWAKYAKLGQKISKIPSFRPSILNPRHPPHHEPSLDNLYIPITSLPPSSSFKPLDSRMYHVRAESIKQIQSRASTNQSKRSRFLSFTAYMWKLLADGDVNSSTDITSRMGVVVNGRRFLKTENSYLFENHYGNVVSVPYGVAATSDIKAMPIHELASRVHGFVGETTNEEHFRGLIDWVELHRPSRAVARIYFGHEESEGKAVVMSSGEGLPIKDMDFGWGKAEFGSYHVPWGSRTGYVITMPSASRDGDWVVYMHLNHKEFDVIERMASNVFTPLSVATLF